MSFQYLSILNANQYFLPVFHPLLFCALLLVDVLTPIVAQHVAHPLVTVEVMGPNLSPQSELKTLKRVPTAAMSGVRHK